MGSRISIDNLAHTVMRQLDSYADLATEDMKKAVKSAGSTVRKQIQAAAPSNTGKYAKSWTVKKTYEDAHSLQMTVHSKNRYQLAHLLEFGHAKRGGGRTRAISHIAPAEEMGVQQLEEDIERSLRDG